MYSLRTIYQTNDLETQEIGDRYFLYRKDISKEFQLHLDLYHGVDRANGIHCEAPEGLFAIIHGHDVTIMLYDCNQYFIMTETGTTLERISKR